MQEAEKRLTLLRIITPRPKSTSQAGSTTFIYKDGKVVEGTAPKATSQSFRDERVTGADWDRHWASVRKQKEMGI